MVNRKKTPQKTEIIVLIKSKRRCCLCSGLNNDLQIKRGQIAHLDRDPSNTKIENLAFMCLHHHAEYDSTNSQSKGFLIGEVKTYIEDLYKKFDDFGEANPPSIKISYAPAKELDYSSREHQKRLSYGLLRSSSHDDQKLGLLMLIEAHFHRQDKNQIPDFKTYVSHWLFANADDFSAKIVKELFMEFGKPKYPRIKKGYSDWGSYGNPNYK